MIKLTGSRSKTKQYVIGGAFAVIILCLWISIPLQNSSVDSSTVSGRLFKTSAADVSSLGGDIPQEGGAPGYALNAEMLNNPAATGESIASSLFQSSPEDETAPISEPMAGPARRPGPPNMSASAGGPGSYSSAPKGKLNFTSAGASGGANSATSGGVHNRLFGSGAAKLDYAPVSRQSYKSAAPSDKRNALVAMLQKTDEKSALAARSANPVAAASGATSAFEKTGQAGASDLNTDVEEGAAASGLALGAAAQDLKRSDPEINKKKVTLPQPTAVKDDNSDEEMKKMIIQTVLNSVLGMFGSMIGSAVSDCPSGNYDKNGKCK